MLNLSNMVLPRLSWACRDSLSFSTGVGTSAPAGLFWTFAESGISLSMGGLAEKTSSSRSLTIFGLCGLLGASAEKSIGFLGNPGLPGANGRRIPESPLPFKIGLPRLGSP